MQIAIASLSQLILSLQGDGNYSAVAILVEERGIIGKQLQQDLDRLSDADIPIDIIFEQGIKVLGLEE